MTQWIDKQVSRGKRDRRADTGLPITLPLLGLPQLEILRRWSRKEREACKRTTLLKEAAPATVEEVEILCERLLSSGWIQRREVLRGGSWQWESFRWLDLPQLQGLLGIENSQDRENKRATVLVHAAHVLEQNATSLEPDVVEALQGVLDQLQESRTTPLETLSTRLQLLEALAQWQLEGQEGTPRDFALRAKGDTKAISNAHWRWLGDNFDLERFRITPFTPMLAMSGPIQLRWAHAQMDMTSLHFAQLPVPDVLRLKSIVSTAQGWWLIENRASFERQARLAIEQMEAQRDHRPQIIVWLPGRPSRHWLSAWRHLLRLSPAPVAISADADPAGVDIACTVGAACSEVGPVWWPEQMGVAQLEAAAQQWPLNLHDRMLLTNLLARPDLPAELRALCESMQTEGRKAEQEGWL